MKSLKDWIFPLVVILGIGIFAMSGRTGASEVDYTFDGEPEIIAATFSSAWCSSCKILEPRLAKVAPGFANQPVKFVKLDFTFGERGELEAKAQNEGLAKVYADYKGATGFSLLIDAQTGEIVDSLTMNHSPEAMRAAISQALAVAEVTN